MNADLAVCYSVSGRSDMHLILVGKKSFQSSKHKTGNGLDPQVDFDFH